MLVRIPPLSLRLSRSLTRCFSSKDWRGETDESIFDTAEDDESSVPSAEPVIRRSALFTSAPVKREPIVEGTPRITVSQALYLAKEAGIFTTRELQTHLIKSPSFSRNDSPFLLENFFSNIEDVSLVYPVAPTVSAPAAEEAEPAEELVPLSIHKLFGGAETFSARGKEWLTRAEGKGTRKRAVAHVVITKGTGMVIVNGREDFYKRWPILSNRLDVLFPFEATGTAGLFDVHIAVRGGGTSGQAGAARLAIGRALVAVNPHCELDLNDSLVLTEDTRQKTSKFPGKKGAYARRNWTLSMCKKCVRPKMDVSVQIGNHVIALHAGEAIFDSITRDVPDAFEAELLVDTVLEILDAIDDSVESESPLGSIRSFRNVGAECIAFNEAICFLSLSDPMRMKTIQQLEIQYDENVSKKKAARKSAQASLQTRQSLEMDMLTNNPQYSKKELEMLVYQHVTELDDLEIYWDAEITNARSKQMQEYMALVMEVYKTHFGTLPVRLSNSFPPTHPVFSAIAVRRDITVPARLVRLIELSGDFFSTVLKPRKMCMRDPEEEFHQEEREPKSAVLLGSHVSGKSTCQQVALLRFIDNEAPTECRWPSFKQQSVGNVPEGIFESYHSNLGLGIERIFHIVDSTCLVDTLKLADTTGIQRIYIPHVIVADLLCPSLPEEDLEFFSCIKGAIRSRLSPNGSLLEVVLIRPS